MNVKIFADGADLASIKALAADAKIAGFTSVIYGWVLLSQLSFALLGGASA